MEPGSDDRGLEVGGLGPLGEGTVGEKGQLGWGWNLARSPLRPTAQASLHSSVLEGGRVLAERGDNEARREALGVGYALCPPRPP